MANVHLPVPVLIAGGSLCVLAGFLVGVVAGPDTPDRTTAEVTSYDEGDGRLCLRVEEMPQAAAADSADGSGQLCGQWQRSSGATTPKAGDSFRYVTSQTADEPGEAGDRLLIFGDVVQ